MQLASASWLLVGACIACAGAPQPPRQQPTAAPAHKIQSIPAASSAAQSEPALPERAPPKNRCLPDGPPQPRVATKRHAPDTCVDHRSAEARLAAKFRKDYDRTVDGSVVDVSFGCDPLTGEVEELVVERGHGHGGGLEVWRIHRSRKQTDWQVLGIALPGYFRVSKARDASPVQIARGTVQDSALSRALRTARPALTASVRELEPPPPPNGAFGRSFSTSSGNFHHYFWLTDGHHELTRHFTGYPSSSEQSRTLAVVAAMDAIEPLLEAVPFAPSTATEQERAFFVTRFLAAAPRFDDPYAWWVRDRYVQLAEHLGSPELVPTLLAVLQSGLREAAAEKDAERRNQARERRLTSPLAALARITGYDPRKDANGVARPLTEAVAEAISECTQGMELAKPPDPSPSEDR